MTHLTYVFVHGLSGWGSYDERYKRFPYWGTWSGDLMEYLRNQGYECYAASVSPSGSAWDRACELYAQISGTRTDYGLAHSREYRHDRLGTDYTGRPLIPSWTADTRLVLIGHSFGGPTIRLFAHLLANGDPEEKNSPDVSPFFTGGMGKRIHSIVTLASPINGTTAYDLAEDESFDPSALKVSPYRRVLNKLMKKGSGITMDGRDERDYASYDMHVDNALRMNEIIRIPEYVYRYSVPFCITKRMPDGTCRPKRYIEALFAQKAGEMGIYTGVSKGGFVFDEHWQDNDGLVNTISEKAPLNEPSVLLDPAHIRPGIWNVFPTIQEDHVWPQGGLMHRHDVHEFYTRLLEIVSSVCE